MSTAKLEQFYSSDRVMGVMVRTLQERIPECKLYVDPSAGDNKLLRKGAPRRAKKLAFDMEPKHRSVVKSNFESPKAQFSVERAIFEAELKTGKKPLVCVASNPPFKRIKRWMSVVEPWADWVMFLGPLQNFRVAYQTNFPQTFRLTWQTNLQGKDSTFLVQGSEVERDTVLQVWQKFEPATILRNLELDNLGITEWEFSSWPKFRSASRQFRVCFSNKTGKTWIATGLTLTGGLERCRVQDSSSKSQPTSVCSLIVCRTKAVQQKLIKIGCLVQAYQPPVGCTRRSFKRTEFAWFWLKYYARDTWKAMSSEHPIAQLENLELSPIDEFLFKGP